MVGFKYVYKLVWSDASFEEAQINCNYYGARLAEAENERDLNEILSFYWRKNTDQNPMSTWIGLTFGDDKVLYWLSSPDDKYSLDTFKEKFNTSLLIQADETKPTCGRLIFNQNELQFNDQDCLKKYNFICQKECLFNPYRKCKKIVFCQTLCLTDFAAQIWAITLIGPVGVNAVNLTITHG